MLTELQVQEFWDRGFLKAGRVMSEEQAEALRVRMFDVMEGRAAGKPELMRDVAQTGMKSLTQIVNIWEADDMFRAHLYHPVICGIIAQLMNADTVRVWHDQVQYKPPKTGGPQIWHQDHPLWPIIQPADLISAWVALDDATVENGCMSMVPHSHRWGPHKEGIIGTDQDRFLPLPDRSLLPEGAQIEVVPCEVKKGEVMFHHCLTWHGSPANGSDRGRPAIAVHYMPGYTRYEPSGRSHPVEHHVEVAPGEPLQGKRFPTVWENGQPVSAPG